MKKQNYRKFETSGGLKVVAGKNQEQNEELVKKFIGKNNLIMHTAKPGSPFCIILGRKKPKRKDIKETAVFCARYSQAWKKPKRKPKQVEVHIFSGKEVYKTKNMKTGTFGVERHKKILVEKKEIEDEPLEKVPKGK